ncbi:putative ATP-dependent endonuclease of OLD family [Erwinia toletana]|uniref:ATP-dependent endonuclease of OLD family n=1 Tax=Winslowiella toletana TaxID=92490 RepID=A0ABS4PEN3_9GAMM|nr:ATP-dependent endonuclease [Winslowiella toletana]MBP2170590.1 putative ATP-dependent endonuclease of OLD family [Winslowiella toletana]
MILESIEITGFRGLNRLALILENNNVLIGENAWGKSSLLDALTLLLAPQPGLYQFTANDFHFPPGNLNQRERHLQITFSFREGEAGHHQAPRYQALNSLWQQGTDGLQHIVYRVSGELDHQQQVTTRHQFLDHNQQPIADNQQQVHALIALHPVLRLRDARFTRRLRHATDATQNASDLDALARQIDTLTRDLVSRPEHLSDHALREGLKTMQQLLEHYFSVQSPEQSSPRGRVSYHARETPQGWRYLNYLNQLIADADSRSRQLIVLQMFALLAQARGAYRLDADARPLLLVEDPETRLHPTMLAVAWGLLELLPLQKITTTNSSELLSQVPVEQVCRLVREPTRVAAWRLAPGIMSAEDSRRIAFHIRFSRPSSLFARCWLLVEGETEVWIMNELARQCGHHFAAEGVKVIEFAQSGLRPLLKFAQRMGIEWHVLTDGDEAGKKYAATARSMFGAQHEVESDHLTQLPALDMEHFLYRQGFNQVYHRIAHLPDNVPMNLRRIIAKAIQRSSKPELAIAVAMDAAERGTASIPPILRQMFSRVLWLARGQAD